MESSKMSNGKFFVGLGIFMAAACASGCTGGPGRDIEVSEVRQQQSSKKKLRVIDEGIHYGLELDEAAKKYILLEKGEPSGLSAELRRFAEFLSKREGRTITASDLLDGSNNNLELEKVVFQDCYWDSAKKWHTGRLFLFCRDADGKLQAYSREAFGEAFIEDDFFILRHYDAIASKMEQFFAEKDIAQKLTRALDIQAGTVQANIDEFPNLYKYLESLGEKWSAHMKKLEDMPSDSDEYDLWSDAHDKLWDEDRFLDSYLRERLSDEQQEAWGGDIPIPFSAPVEQQLGFRSERQMRKVLARTESIDIEYGHHYRHTKEEIEPMDIDLKVTYHLRGSKKVVKHVHSAALELFLLSPAEMAELAKYNQDLQNTMADEGTARDTGNGRSRDKAAQPYDNGIVYEAPED